MIWILICGIVGLTGCGCMWQGLSTRRLNLAYLGFGLMLLAFAGLQWRA